MNVKKRFELHQVLNYRVEQEKVRKLEFATAKREFESACDHLAFEKRAVHELQQEFSCKQSQINTIAELQMYADFFERKKEEIRLQQEKVTALDRIMDDKRNDLKEATLDKKVLESLKERQEAAFRQAMSQRENNFLDEISVQKKGKESCE
jgi:flagellar protein FliJ